MPGSHKCGRLEHGPIGGQQGANLERIELLKQKFPIIPVEMDAGTVIYSCLLKYRKKLLDQRWSENTLGNHADTLVIVIHTFCESAEIHIHIAGNTVSQDQDILYNNQSIKQQCRQYDKSCCVVGKISLQSFLGDTMIFHANIVHKSNANNSNRRRWALLISYNTKENESPVKHHHASYEKIDVVRK